MSLKRYFLLLEILTGFFISFLLLTIFFSTSTDFEKQALGEETVTSPAVDSTGKSIHLLHLSQDEVVPFIEAWKGRGQKEVVLILGNSQTHSINQKKTGEVIYAEMLHNKFKNNAYEILCASLPNASLQDFFLTYSYLKNKINVKKLILPVFFDDLREDGLRDVYFSKLISDKFLLTDSSHLLTKKINHELKLHWGNMTSNDQINTSNKSNPTTQETTQEKSEMILNKMLDQHSDAWRNRPNVRGAFFVWLYQLRNVVFGISASSIRKMIPNRYFWNWNALKELIQDCTKNNIDVFLYVPPIRFDLPIPYDSAMYSNFKKELSELINSNPKHIFFKNYESIVPGYLWGYKGSTGLNKEREVDYMHFQFRGHVILADSIAKALLSQPNDF